MPPRGHHRLDGEDHARQQAGPPARPTVVWHPRRLVHLPPDPVAGEQAQRDHEDSVEDRDREQAERPEKATDTVHEQGQA